MIIATHDMTIQNIWISAEAGLNEWVNPIRTQLAAILFSTK
ncbi:hypothetical protein N8353_05485 [Octadecabacter sp.]|nr:hypothetical protein [Octadecabacter sp.]